MALTIHDPLLNIKVSSSVCSFVAGVTTVSRLWIRRGRYWWDDGCALFSLLCLLVQIAGVFMHVPNPADLSRMNRIAAYYLIATCFYAIIWSARLSILFSVVRIETNPNKRRYLIWIAWLFAITAVFLIAQLFWVCEPEPHWKDAVSPQCKLTKQVVICQLVTDIFSDLILMLAPLSLIRNLQDVALRRRLTLIFSTSIITTIVSLVHAAFIFQDGGSKVLVAAFVENTISLIVCNLPVIAALAFRLKSGGTSDDIKRSSSVRFKSTSGGSASRGTRNRSNLNAIDITTTIALDEMHDHAHDQYGTASALRNPFKSISGSREDVRASSQLDVPPPVHVVGYTYSEPGNNWENGPDTGMPFGSYWKKADHDDKDSSDGDQPKPEPKSKSDGSHADSRSRIVFAEMPRAPREH